MIIAQKYCRILGFGILWRGNTCTIYACTLASKAQKYNKYKENSGRMRPKCKAKHFSKPGTSISIVPGQIKLLSMKQHYNRISAHWTLVQNSATIHKWFVIRAEDENWRSYVKSSFEIVIFSKDSTWTGTITRSQNQVHHNNRKLHYLFLSTTLIFTTVSANFLQC